MPETDQTELRIAVFADFENLAIGAAQLSRGPFQIEVVLNRLLQKGRLVYKRAYCDWGHWAREKKSFHQHGIELVDIPQGGVSGKNSADIRMVVDALDLCYSKSHIDAFALLSGDSDFTPLVAKLKENDKLVLGVGVRNSTSNLLVQSCDEFIFYDDLIEPKRRGRAEPPAATDDPRAAALAQVTEIVQSLEQDYDTVWGSMVKQTIRRVDPGFSERALGFTSFGELLEEASKRGLLRISADERSGNVSVRSAH